MRPLKLRLSLDHQARLQEAATARKLTRAEYVAALVVRELERDERVSRLRSDQTLRQVW